MNASRPSTEGIYLDYAATSAIRPPAVCAAMVEYLSEIGATPGRSGHARSVRASRLVLRCRRAIARLLGIPGDPGRIVFQLNATHALNTALFGLLGPGERVVRTAWDHNAVRRPLAALVGRGVRVDVVPGTADGGLELPVAERLLRSDPPPRLLVVPHASNLTGALLPVRELTALAHEVGALVLLDAAQSVGHLPVDADAMGVDLMAFSGHKGLLGPQGVGALWVREGVTLAPLLYGGTGGASSGAAMPDAFPDRLEAGTQNGPGIAGLLAGVEWLTACGVGALHAREVSLAAALWDGAQRIEGVHLHSPDPRNGLGIVTLTADRVPPALLARRLEAEHGVEVRAGLHCAPEAHAVLGTEATGAVRFSVGWASARADVGRALRALEQLTEQEAGDG